LLHITSGLFVVSPSAFDVYVDAVEKKPSRDKLVAVPVCGFVVFIPSQSFSSNAFASCGLLIWLSGDNWCCFG